MGIKLNLLGQKFGRLLVISEHLEPKCYSMWVCKCDCGKEKIVRSALLINGNTSSCGCLRVELSIKRATKHGGKGTPEYSSWRTMRRRCYDKKCKDYPTYGAIGISVCERWIKSFPNFLEDMGKKPNPIWTLDRIDSKGNYEHLNCRWADAEIQANNTNRNVSVSFNGISKNISQWQREFNLYEDYFYKRRKGKRNPKTNEQILEDLFIKHNIN